MSDFENYKVEAMEKWGSTEAYKEQIEKTKNYSKDKWNNLSEEMDNIFKDFSICMKNAEKLSSENVQSLVKKLQKHITDNYYHCSNEILKGLGQMYILDKRFKTNIDKHADGTAEFVSKAIEIFCNN